MRRAATVALLAVLVSQCGVIETDPAPGTRAADDAARGSATASLRPIGLPDLTPMTASVQEQIRAQYASLSEVLERPLTTAIERSTAYGAMGNLFMAAELFEVAKSCYMNAQALAPDDVRWPYFLAHLHRSTGEHGTSEAFFEQVLRLRPDDVPTLVWLGQSYLAQDRPEAAEPPFEKALLLQPGLAAALAGLGRASLAQRQYARAAEQLEAALAREPDATSLHYPLGMAYRGLGESDTAEVHLRQRGDIEVLLPDPLLQALGGLLHSATAHESRGIRALEHEEWEAAAAAFRTGLELEPENASLRHRLGTALFLTGDALGAVEQFEETLRVAPEFGQAHYSLGVMHASAGRFDEAIKRFATAVRFEPSYVEARVGLADLLRQTGRPEDSLAHYALVVEMDPRVADAWFGHAMALVRLARYAEARDRLVQATRLHVHHPELSLALARLLAAAPDAQVRDGARAMAVVEALPAAPRTIDMGETMAMILAELGQYAEAAALQRDLIAAAEQQARGDLVRGMAENLSRYERGQPCRTPWRDGAMP